MENRITAVNEWVVDDNIERIKEEMRSHGYDYDDIDSDPEGGYIVFNSEYGTFPSGGFSSWEDVQNWLDEVVFDESTKTNIQESMAGYVISDRNGNVISFKNGHRSFAPLGDNAVVYLNPDAANNALYIFSNHCGVQGLSIKQVDSYGNLLECVSESSGESTDDDSSDSSLKQAVNYNKDKFLQKTGGKATLKGGVKDGIKHGIKVGQKFAAKKAGAKVVAKAATKAATKAAAKAVGKTVLKKVPFVSLGVGAKYAFDRARKGDFLGSVGELGSGIAGCIPGAGTAVSLGIDAALAAKDVKDAVDDEKKVAAASEKSNGVSENFDGAETEEYPIPCDGLAKRKTIRAAQNYIYDNILPVIKGLFKDVYWEPIHRVFEILSSEMGMNVNFGARNDSYYQHGYSLDGKSKAWQFDAKYRNNFGKNIKLNGQIIAHAAGTVEDPMCRYDLTFQLF